MKWLLPMFLVSFSLWAQEGVSYRYLPLTRVQWASNGEKYFYWTADRKVYSYELKTNKRLLILKSDGQISPTGKYAIEVGGDRERPKLVIHDLEAKQVVDFPLDFIPKKLCFSQDERYVLLGEDDLYLFLLKEYVEWGKVHQDYVRASYLGGTDGNNDFLEGELAQLSSSYIVKLLEFPRDAKGPFNVLMRLDGFSISPDSQSVVFSIWHSRSMFGNNMRETFTGHYDFSKIDAHVKALDAVEKDNLHERQWARWRAIHNHDGSTSKISDHWGTTFHWIGNSTVAISSHLGLKIHDISNQKLVFEDKLAGTGMDISSEGLFVGLDWKIKSDEDGKILVHDQVKVFSLSRPGNVLRFNSEGISEQQELKLSPDADKILFLSDFTDENDVRIHRPAVVSIKDLREGTSLDDLQGVIEFGGPAHRIISLQGEIQRLAKNLRIAAPVVVRKDLTLAIQGALINQSLVDYFETSMPHLNDISCELRDMKGSLVSDNSEGIRLAAVENVLIAPGESYSYFCELYLPQDTKFGEQFKLTMELKGQPWTKSTITYTVRQQSGD